MTKKCLFSFSSSENVVSHSTAIKNMYMYFIVILFLLKSPPRPPEIIRLHCTGSQMPIKLKQTRFSPRNKGLVKPWLFFSVRFHCELHEVGSARSRRWWPPVLPASRRSGTRSDCTRCSTCPLDARVRSFRSCCCWCSSPHSCSCGRLNAARTPTLMRDTD